MRTLVGQLDEEEDLAEDDMRVVDGLQALLELNVAEIH
jgi:hypothetical protein